MLTSECPWIEKHIHLSASVALIVLRTMLYINMIINNYSAGVSARRCTKWNAYKEINNKFIMYFEAILFSKRQCLSQEPLGNINLFTSSLLNDP